jgi:glyoxylase-like metal-dependent hydrolase (beta-lactamase superfamily II)
VIDPGGDGGEIEERVVYGQLKVKLILLTHGHFDHTLGAMGLKMATGAEIVMNKADEFLTKRQTKTGEFFLRRKVVSPFILEVDLDTDSTKLSKYGFGDIKILELPGHTPGGTGFYFSENKWLFSGDTVFEDGVGEFGHEYSHKNHLYVSIRKIMELPSETIIYPGHGEEFSVETLRKGLGSYLL